MADGLALNTGLMLELRTTHPLWADSVMVMQLREQRQRKAEEHRKEQVHFVRSPPVSRDFNPYMINVM